MVIIKDCALSLQFLVIKEWCDQVTVIPDANNTTVFSSGTLHGDKGLIPVGGQFLPSSIVGANLLWKKAQKKSKKKANL